MRIERQYESQRLLLVLNIIFSTLISIYIAYLVSKSFLERGTLGMLMVDCGVLIWGLSALVATSAGLIKNPENKFDINEVITIHNICVCLSAFCHFTGAILSLQTRIVRLKLFSLISAFAISILTVALIVFMTMMREIPVFFVQGIGGTMIRYVVLSLTIFMFIFTAFLLREMSTRPINAFIKWYSLALLLIAIGITGNMIDSMSGSVLSWISRACQYLGGVYMLIAAVETVNGSAGTKGISLKEALHITERRYKTLFESMTEGLALHELIFDKKGVPCDCRFLEVNPAFEKLTGLKRQDVIGRLSSEVLPNNDLHWLEIFGRVTLTGEPVHFDSFSKPLQKYYEVYAYRTAEFQFAVLFSDITERKRSQEAIQLSEQKYRELIETSNSIIMKADRNLNITFMNDFGLKFFGYTAGELIGKNVVGTTIPPTDDEYRDLAAMANDLKKHPNKYAINVHKNMRKNGELIWVSWTNKVKYDKKGNVTEILAIGNDITDLKKTEQQLKEVNAELMRSNKELQTFAYVASHDLREPLRAISGFVGLLGMKYANKLDIQAKKYIDLASQGVMRMDGLLSCLLEYSRVNTRGAEMMPTDSRAALNAAIANLNASIAETKAMITHDDLPTVLADSRQLSQLFQNLIHNAVKFKNNKKPKIHIGCKKHEDRWVFSVKDNGIGIEPQNFERIFKIFQRVHANGRYPGHGIGLSICRKIVERHGGKIWVESETGKGTTFYFNLEAGNEINNNKVLETESL